jgi:hypothetical protein
VAFYSAEWPLKKSSFYFVLVAVLLFASTIPAAFASTKQQSSIYTGYEVTGPYSTLRVKGTWIVPTANCSKTPNSVSNISVIIDGIKGEGDAMEIGTYQNCVNGVAQYGAFLNVYPETRFNGNSSSIKKFVVHPGDVIEAQGTWRSPSTPIDWNTNIVNENTCTQLDTDARTPSGFTPKDNSGAVVLSSDGHTLTALSTVQSGEKYTSSVTCHGGGVQGSTGSDITGPEHETISFGTMGSMSGYTLIALEAPGTSLGALSDGGTSFEITDA